MFRNDGGRRFQDVTTAGNFGHLQKGHGVAFGDLDNDGDQDVFEQMGGAFGRRAYSVLFENPRRQAGGAASTTVADWVSLELEGTSANRAAIGARASRVRSRRRPAHGDIHRVVSTGGSFGSQPFRMFVGLGDATRNRRHRRDLADRSDRPPRRCRCRRCRGLASGRHYRLKQGAAAPTELQRSALTLSHTTKSTRALVWPAAPRCLAAVAVLAALAAARTPRPGRHRAARRRHARDGRGSGPARRRHPAADLWINLNTVRAELAPRTSSAAPARRGAAGPLHSYANELLFAGRIRGDRADRRSCCEAVDRAGSARSGAEAFITC